MNRNPRRFFRALSRASLGAAALGLVSASVSAAEVEELIVTARKREESLQTIPIALTAVSGRSLEVRGAQNLSAVESIAPNVHFSSNQPTSGLPGSTAVFIRGIGQRDFTINIDPAVGIYFDGVYIGRSIGALLDLVDVERVEVLRGPQNTLFGRNTIGGAISVVSKQPADTFSGTIRANGGESGYAEASAQVAVPLSRSIATSFNAFYKHQDGYVDALQYNGGLKLGEDNTWGIRGKIAVTFSEMFSLDVAGDLAITRSAPGAVVPIKINTLLPVGTAGTGPFNTFFNNSLTLSGDAACRTTQGQSTNPKCYGSVWKSASPYATNAVFTDNKGNKILPEDQMDVGGLSATLTANLPIGTLKSITAYRGFDAVSYNDNDFSPFTLFANNHPDYSQHQISEELQFVGDAWNGKLDYVFGLFYFQEKGLERIYNQVVTSISATNPGGLAQDIYRNIDNTSKAGYAQVGYHVTDTVTLTGGMRYTDDVKNFTIKNILPTGAVDGPHFGTQKASKWTPMVTLGWNATPAIYAYATYSEGFRDGGFAARFLGTLPTILPSYNPEFVKSYEIGLKNRLLGDKVRLNLAGFQTDYSDLQVDATVPPQLQISQTSAILNLAQARMTGFEAELDASLTDWLRVDGSVGYLQAKVLSVLGDKLATGAFFITTATRLPFTPHWNGNLGVSVSPHVTADARAVARLDWAYTGGQYMGVEGNPELFEPGHSILGASLRYVPDHGRWDVGVGVRNLTDKVYFNQRVNIQALNSTFGAIARPRTVYVSAKYNF